MEERDKPALLASASGGQSPKVMDVPLAFTFHLSTARLSRGVKSLSNMAASKLIRPACRSGSTPHLAKLGKIAAAR